MDQTLSPPTPSVPYVLTDQIVNAKPDKDQITSTVTDYDRIYKVILAISLLYLAKRILF